MVDFPKSFFSGNRLKLTKHISADLIVMSANGQMQRNSDSPYLFRQDSNFWYLTGLEIADAVLVIDLKHHEEWLILPERSEYENIFDGSLANDVLSKTSDIAQILDCHTGWAKLQKLLSTNAVVATTVAPPAFIDIYAIYTNPARARLMERLKQLGVSNFIDLRTALAELRIVKQPIEISAIKKAIEITVETMQCIQEQLGSYKNEREIEADLTAGYRRLGAKGHSFDPIVASGANTCVLHYQENEANLKKGQLVLIDTGAEVRNYAADITRTYPLGKVSSRQAEVYRAVYDAQQLGISLMKPGAYFRDVEAAVCDSIEKSLKRLKLKPINNQSLLRSYYPHAPHHMGLDVHDVGDPEKVLEAGMILTMEPGIYIAAEEIGVRIEDDILITESGCENLSVNLASSPESILGLGH